MRILCNHIGNYRKRMNYIGIQNKFVFNINIKFSIVAKFNYICIFKINTSSLQDSSLCVLCCLLKLFYFHSSKIYLFIYFFYYLLFFSFLFLFKSFLPILVSTNTPATSTNPFNSKRGCIYSCASYCLNQIMNTLMFFSSFNSLIV